MMDSHHATKNQTASMTCDERGRLLGWQQKWAASRSCQTKKVMNALYPPKLLPLKIRSL